MARDEFVQSAIDNWAPRFISNGVDANDFQRVTNSIERWDDWCQKWSECGAMHEHYGFEPSHTTPLFKRAGFALERERSFQLRLNHLFVFRRGIEATNRKVTTEGRADPGVLVGREANT